jgi:hypothetical protein
MFSSIGQFQETLPEQLAKKLSQHKSALVANRRKTELH